MEEWKWTTTWEWKKEMEGRNGGMELRPEWKEWRVEWNGMGQNERRGRRRLESGKDEPVGFRMRNAHSSHYTCHQADTNDNCDKHMSNVSRGKEADDNYYDPQPKPAAR